ncbi:MAG: hypothetical protein ACI9N0_001596 [Ilumatobacter sp.]|jgi:hypothetical protein
MSTESVPTTLFEHLTEFFAELGWDAVPVPGEPILGVTVRTASGAENTLVASTDEVARVISFFARPPFAVPEKLRRDIVHLLNDVNFQLNDGTWMVDPADGELRFRTGLQCGSTLPSGEQIRRTAGYALVGIEAHLPVLEDWIAGNIDRDDALERMVGTQRSS